MSVKTFKVVCFVAAIAWFIAAWLSLSIENHDHSEIVGGVSATFSFIFLLLVIAPLSKGKPLSKMCYGVTNLLLVTAGLVFVTLGLVLYEELNDLSEAASSWTFAFCFFVLAVFPQHDRD